MRMIQLTMSVHNVIQQLQISFIYSATLNCSSYNVNVLLVKLH